MKLPQKPSLHICASAAIEMTPSGPRPYNGSVPTIETLRKQYYVVWVLEMGYTWPLLRSLGLGAKQDGSRQPGSDYFDGGTVISRNPYLLKQGRFVGMRRILLRTAGQATAETGLIAFDAWNQIEDEFARTHK